MTISEGRVEQIYEWLEDRIEEWKGVPSDELDLSPVVLEDIEDKLRSRTILAKHQSKVLGKFIMDELTDRVINSSEYRGYMNMVQYVDELAIYTDAWYHFCRPGTYSISI